MEAHMKALKDAIKAVGLLEPLVTALGASVGIIAQFLPDSLVPSPTLKNFVSIACTFGALAAFLYTPLRWKGESKEKRQNNSRKKLLAALGCLGAICVLLFVLSVNGARLWSVIEFIRELMLDYSLFACLVFAFAWGFMVYFVCSALILVAPGMARRSSPKDTKCSAAADKDAKTPSCNKGAELPKVQRSVKA
jgi:hypothetical protein